MSRKTKPATRAAAPAAPVPASDATDGGRQIETHHATWRGIEIEVSFERNWLGLPPSEFHPSHLAVLSVAPSRVALPVTETGYRSHFLPGTSIDEAGGPVAYTLAWLDDAAQGREWQRQVAAGRQLSLF